MRIGYACINMTLGSNKNRVTTNRGMVKKTFSDKGLEYVSELVIENLKDLITIIKWNYKNGIDFYRMSSDMFPWMSEYKFEDLPNFEKIKELLVEAGKLAFEYDQRLTFHPGPFNVLCSPKEDVVIKTIDELNKHAQIMDMMQLSATPYNKINIHIGGVYGDKESALERWVENFSRLGETTKSRLTIENDDKTSCYTVKDLMYVSEKLNIPIVFDYHHHQFCTGGLSEEEALKLAATTWPDGIRQEVHYSESKALHENNPKEKPQAHSLYINALPNTYGLDVDIMVEAKGKELAILPFIK